MKRSLYLLVLAGLAITLALPAPVAAQLPPLIPRATIFGNPDKTNPQLSPDGSRLAYLAPNDKNVLQVWVRTVGQDDARAVTKDPKRGIQQYLWAPSGKQVLYLQDNDGDENYHLYLTDLETNDSRDLTPYLGVRAIPVAVDADFPNEILVGMNRRNRQIFDVYRVDLATGGVTLEVENPGNVGGWETDLNLKVRARTRQNPDGSSDLEVRDTAESDWRKALSWGVGDQVVPVAFTADGKGLYLTSDLGANAARLVVMDCATGQTKVISEDPGYDVSSVALHPKTNVVLAVQYNKARHEWVILDPGLKPDYAAIPKLSDGDYFVASGTEDNQTWLVGFTRDAGGVRYYKWDRAAQKGEFLFAARPRLDEYKLAPMEPVTVTARDGLKLQCYLTKPVGVPAKSLPMVVFVHGGPWARDEWGYSSYPQWFANRGYACLQVNYRGSSGFGKKFLHAADHEFAGKMHDDLLDAVSWAVKQGVADKSRIAVMGGSYGGYATLVGLTFTPDVFACGIDLVGPSNLVSLIESFPPYWKPFLASSWYPRVGDPSDPAQRQDLEARSPLFKVDRIQKPLMIVQGANDPRVTKKESDQIVTAMQKAGKPVEYYVFADEGHGLARPDNRLKFAAYAEQFLAKHLGGRAEPITAEVQMEQGTVSPPEVLPPAAK